MRVLGIESSCDETGIGLVDSEQGVIGQALFSQSQLHEPYGGVVPELASRDHACRFIPLIDEALGNTSLDKVDAIAYTAGPGLIGALLTGSVFAHSLAMALNIPALAIHHLEAHLLTLQLDDPAPSPPFVALIVSGGHTQLVFVETAGQYQLLGETRDDAAGEAFDKTAKALGLGYPGGPEIERLAQQGHSGRFTLPRPMLAGLEFSFSGLKTSVLRLIEQSPNDAQTHADIALAFEEAVIDTLVHKCQLALKETNAHSLAIAGGVSANTRLRQALRAFSAAVFFPAHELCTDNGVMIAYAGLSRCKTASAQFPDVYPRWDMTTL